MSEDPARKICTKCRASLGLGAFGVSRQNPDGLKRWCKPCSAAHLKAWAAANPDKVAERKARFRSANREGLRRRSAEQRRKDPAASKEAWAKWHEKNPGAKNKAASKWAANNRPALATQAAKRRATKLQATPLWATDELEALVIAEAYRLSPLRFALTGVEHEVDHIVPLLSDRVCGLHCAANLRVIPKALNRAKNNRFWPDMPA